MTERIDTALSHQQHENRPFDLLLLDLDYFKSINDKHGHSVGDEALTVLAELIRAMRGPYDSAARWGGDEFLILVLNCDAVTLQRLGELICAMVALNRQFCDHAADPISFSVSISGALASGDDVEGMISKADQGLYAAKNAGRNCFRLFIPAASAKHGLAGTFT